MPRLQCPNCGQILGPGPRCPGCGASVDRGRTWRIAAAESLRERIARDADLDGELAVELIERIVGYLDEERDRAAAVAAREAAAVTPAEPPPVPAAARARAVVRNTTPEPTAIAPEPAAPRPPSVWSRLGPAFAENLLFALAAFLIIGGAVYFGTTAWTTMTGTTRLVVVVGGLAGLAAVLRGAGRLLNRRDTLPEVERVLAVVAAFIAPLATTVTGELASSDVTLGLSVGVATLAASAWFARSAAARLHAGLSRALPLGVVAAGGLALLLPADRAPLGSAFLVGVLVMAFGIVAGRRAGAPSAPWWIALAIVAFAALADGAAVALRVGLHPLGVVGAAVGAAITVVELGRARRIEAPRAGGSLAMLLGVGLALTGMALAAGAPTALLLSAIAAAFATCAVAVRFDRAQLLWPGLALSVVAYFLSPAPVRELAMEIRALVAGELGYEPQRLPLSFYGITFLPYLAVSGLVAEWLRRRGREAFAQVTLSWTLAVATALAGLAIFAGADARAPMAVLPAEGALLLALGGVTRRQRLVFAGALGVVGGAVAGLAHFEPVDPVTLGVLVACGLALIGSAAWLQQRAPEDAFRRRAAHALIDASGVLAIGGAGFAVTVWLDDGLAAGMTAGLLGTALWLGVLADAYGVAIVRLVAWGMVALALRAVLGAGAHTASWTAVWFALASAAPVLASGRVHLPRLVERTAPGLASDRPDAAALGPFLFQAFALAAIVARLQVGESDGALVLAAIIAAVVAGTAAVTCRAPWLAVVAGVELLGAALLAIEAVGLDASGFATAAALGVGALVSVAVADLARGRERLEALAPIASTGACAAGGALLWPWLVIDRLVFAANNDPSAALPPWPDPGALLAGCTAVVATAWLLARRGGGFVLAARVLAAVAVPMAVLALWDVLDASGSRFASGLAVAAAIAALTARNRLPEQVAVLAALALAVAIGHLLPPRPGDGLLVTALAITALVAHPGITRPRAFGTALALAAWTALVWAAWSWARPATDPLWIVVIGTGAAAVAELARGVRPLRLDGAGVSWFSAPVAALVALFGAVHAIGCIFDGRAPVLRGVSLDKSEEQALAMLALAIGLIVHRERAPLVRGMAAVTLAVGALFLAPVLERTLLDQGPSTVLPSVGVALLGVVIAWARYRTTAITIAIAAVLLTALDFVPVTTPVAFAVGAFVPLVTGLRLRRASDIATFADGLLLAGVAMVLHSSHPNDAEVLPWLGLVAAALGAVFAAAPRLMAGRDEFGVACRTAIDRAASRVVDVGLLLIGAAVATELVAGERHAIAWPAWPALLTAAVGAALPLRSLRTSPRPIDAHRLVVALTIAYGYIATNTTHLEFLGAQKANVLSLAAVGLLLARPTLPVVTGRALAIDALLLPLPAIFGIGPTPSAAGAVALALASAPYAVAARVCAWRFSGWIAALLLNAAVWSLWLHRGVADLAFYGLPLGLTLAVGSEFTRHRAARAVARVVGLVLAYGSIVVQVLRVEEPTHALVLFALGLATVALGWLRRRNDLLLAGTAAVVVDVVAYLARHGLARDFVGAGLLIAAGVTVLFVAIATRSGNKSHPV